MERMQITECLSAPLDILLMAKVTVLQPEVRHNTVFAQGTPCLQSIAEVNAIKHRSLTSTNSHSKQGHVGVYRLTGTAIVCGSSLGFFISAEM